MTPEEFGREMNIKVKIGTKALAIDRLNKKVHIHELETGSESWESYDILVLATGAQVAMPSIEGISNEGVFALSVCLQR